MTSRLAVQQALLPGSTPMEQFQHAAAFGFDGVELNHGARFDVGEQRELIADASRETGVAVAAICTTGQQDPVHPDHHERERRVRELVELADAASALGAAGVVSVPVRPSAGWEEAPLPDVAIEIYQYVADALSEGSAAIFLEPLNRYEAAFLNRVGQAAVLARMIDRPRVRARQPVHHDGGLRPPHRRGVPRRPHLDLPGEAARAGDRTRPHHAVGVPDSRPGVRWAVVPRQRPRRVPLGR